MSIKLIYITKELHKLTWFWPCSLQLRGHRVGHESEGDTQEGGHEGQPDDKTCSALTGVVEVGVSGLPVLLLQHCGHGLANARCIVFLDNPFSWCRRRRCRRRWCWSRYRSRRCRSCCGRRSSRSDGRLHEFEMRLPWLAVFVEPCLNILVDRHLVVHGSRKGSRRRWREVRVRDGEARLVAKAVEGINWPVDGNFFFPLHFGQSFWRGRIQPRRRLTQERSKSQLCVA